MERPGYRNHLINMFVVLGLGFCSVSKKSINNILRNGPGCSVMIVPGGAAESLYAFPNKYDLVIKRRLGFIKLAMQNGASLVPVHSILLTPLGPRIRRDGYLLASRQPKRLLDPQLPRFLPKVRVVCSAILPRSRCFAI